MFAEVKYWGEMTTRWELRGKASIVGIGETRYTKAGAAAQSVLGLACEAIVNALADAGLAPADVDGICTYATERCSPASVAQVLGFGSVQFVGISPGGGSAAAGVVHSAVMAVGSRAVRTVICYRSICQGPQGRFGRASENALKGEIIGTQAFTVPFGLLAPVHGYAMEARRHMHRFGTRSEHFGLVAVAAYDNAQRNPRAIMHGKTLTLAEHQQSRVIADPYRLYDCCQESDGACAIVITHSERAADCRQVPATILASAHGLASTDGPDRHARSEDLWDSTGLAEVAELLYQRAGVGPSDIGVAQFYENFTGQVLMGLEDFGFCARGEGGAYVESGAITWPTGRLPINTSGGHLAEAYIQGLNPIAEGVRQIRGSSTSQVADAAHCLVVGGPGAPPSGAMILRRSS